MGGGSNTKPRNGANHKPAKAKASSSAIKASTTTTPTSNKLPKNWPASLPYHAHPVLSPSFPRALLETLHTAPAAHPAPVVHALPPSPNASVLITPIATPGHPACGQAGLFARAALPPGALILTYSGTLHTRADADAASDYDLSLDRELGVGVDAAGGGNEARFVNDYRGVPGVTAPNAEFGDVWVELDGAKRVERRMGVWVLGKGKNGKGPRARGIRKGEEILVSYGKGFWRERLAGDMDEGDGDVMDGQARVD
ncbi:uncharacterized protein J3D65DRAFT_634762 [Phyllosticta citribraziliensis]|uniref:SET domain-containing protein n=1 Tax=Phyllosticta citribraziliensis TaxID=989973 RepID=A0ABR1LFD5_9PEZI